MKRNIRWKSGEKLRIAWLSHRELVSAHCDTVIGQDYRHIFSRRNACPCTFYSNVVIVGSRDAICIRTSVVQVHNGSPCSHIPLETSSCHWSHSERRFDIVTTARIRSIEPPEACIHVHFKNDNRHINHDIIFFPFIMVMSRPAVG